jgi:sRNA-binding regulator protein Hfq
MKLNTKYEILSPEGFVDFLGIQKLKKKTREIFFTNGLTLRASYNHKIFDFDGNEILIKNVKKEDLIKSHDGYFTIEKIIDYEYESDVYDIVDAGEMHLYFTNNIVSHNCDFLGSGDGVIPNDVQENIAKNMIRVPKEKYMQGTFWQWKEPIQGHRYIAGIDVSRGDSEDFSSINIIDFDEREQVVEYIGKIPPDDLAAIAYKWGILYGNAFIVIDITGGMGIATSRKLQEMNYKNLFIDGINTQNIWEYNKKTLEKIPGINFNNKRTQIIAAFEEQLRKGFQIRSSRLLNELNTFVYINGRPDHMKGAHDDSIMSLSVALYAGDLCFNQLERTDSVNKAVIDSWMLSERTYEVNKSFYSYGQTMDPLGALQTNDSLFHANNPMNNTKEMYKEYSWLFGRKR